MRIFLVLTLAVFTGACAQSSNLQTMPNVVFDEPEKIRAALCPKDGCATVRAIAYYNRKTQTIHLAKNWSANREYDLSALLHEFIHHLQNLNGYQRSSCNGDKERQAYEAQIAFLKERGNTNINFLMGLNEFTRYDIYNCGLS